MFKTTNMLVIAIKTLNMLYTCPVFALHGACSTGAKTEDYFNVTVIHSNVSAIG